MLLQGKSLQMDAFVKCIVKLEKFIDFTFKIQISVSESPKLKKDFFYL